MRIGLFTDTYPPEVNGVATSVSMLKQALEKLGHTVYVVTTNVDGFRYSEDVKERVLRIPGLKTAFYDYRFALTYPVKAINKIKTWKLDVMHCHTEFGIGVLARILSKQLNLPLVYTYHTMYEEYIYYITKGMFKKSGRFLVEELTHLLGDKLISELVVPTEKAKDLLKEKYKIEREVHVVSNGVNLEQFYQENHDKNEIKALEKKFGIKDSDVVVIFVGRMASEKNVKFLIDAQKELVVVNDNIKLLLVGGGPELDDYKKYAEKLGIAKNVVCTDKVLLKDVAKYYQMADIFATASFTETQGMTVFEAMAASLPAICLDDYSFRTMVRENENGHFFKTKKTYVKLILELVNDKKERLAMGKRARESTAPYSSDVYAKKILEVYKKAIDERPAHSVALLGVIKKIGGKDKNE